MASTSNASKKVSDSAKNRRGTEYKVVFPTLPNLTKQPNSIEVHQGMNKHDVIVLKFRTVSKTTAKLLKTGVPFTLKWTQLQKTRIIYGYVTHVSNETTGQKTAKMQVNAVGASFPLKQRSSKIHKKMTITEVASLIAKNHHLKFVGDPHPHKYDQLAVSGHSDWAWLTEHAKRIGYGLMIDGVTLVFKPLDKLLDQSVTNAPIMSMFNVPFPINNLFYDRTLDYFRVLSGENIEATDYQRAVKNTGGVNPQTGKSFTSKASPKKVGKNLRKKVSDVLFEEYMSNHVVNSGEAARLTAEGAAHLARLNLPAIAKGQGDPRLKPFAPVYITGINEEVDGYWIVNSVVHYLKFTGEYTVEMIVSTDGLGEPTDARSAVPAASTSISGKGMVDINAALNNQRIDSTSSLKNTTNSSVRLSTKDVLFKEGDQGFNRTPTTWKANNTGPRKVC